MQTKYEYYWLYGAFDVLIGESFYCEYNRMNKINCQHFIDQLSLDYPDTINIILMDNSKTHFIDKFPDNIKFINNEPYSPELNPAESVWREFKDKMGWKIFEEIDKLKEHISKTINELTNEKIISLIQYPYIIEACHALNI